MYNEDLKQQYQNKSNIELLLIARNYDSGYTDDAIETAKSILNTRYEGEIDLNKIWQMEVNYLFDLDKKCSLCQKKDIAYSEPMYLCTMEEIDTKGSILGFIALAAVGVGYSKQKFNYMQIEFKLCSDCLLNRSDVRKPRAKPKIKWEEYHMHPLYNLYRCFGFIETRTQI